MSCCFRYLSLLARRTLAVVVLGYKVRNCYALSVTHFIRRQLRGYAVTPLRILYPTSSEVSWVRSVLGPKCLYTNQVLYQLSQINAGIQCLKVLLMLDS